MVSKRKVNQISEKKENQNRVQSVMRGQVWFDNSNFTFSPASFFLFSLFLLSYSLSSSLSFILHQHIEIYDKTDSFFSFISFFPQIVPSFKRLCSKNLKGGKEKSERRRKRKKGGKKEGKKEESESENRMTMIVDLDVNLCFSFHSKKWWIN